MTAPDRQVVEVLLQVDGRPAIQAGVIFTDPRQCGLTQLGVGLVDLGERMLACAERWDEEAAS